MTATDLEVGAFSDDPPWEIRQESILDTVPGPADVVYSWGVLHHTGSMWEALNKALECVEPGGRALIALYNRPRSPAIQITLKRTYNRLPRLARPAMRLAAHKLQQSAKFADYAILYRGNHQARVFKV